MNTCNTTDVLTIVWLGVLLPGFLFTAFAYWWSEGRK